MAGAPDLEGGAGGVLVVLLGGVVWMGTATAPAAQATKWIRLGVLFTLQLPSRIMIIVCAGA
ncbi:MAG: hypothetical protein ACRDRO_04430 [Pseudonocardiaceae bacterium]